MTISTPLLYHIKKEQKTKTKTKTNKRTNKQTNKQKIFTLQIVTKKSKTIFEFKVIPKITLKQEITFQTSQSNTRANRTFLHPDDLYRSKLFRVN